MSFSSDVKEEMINIETDKPCCVHALAYGLALFGKSFSLYNISLLTENEKVAYGYAENIEKVSGVSVDFEKSKSGKVTATIQKDRAKVLESFGHTGKEVALRLNRANIEDDCCISAFLRGAFLSCGFVTDPNKNYHIEFVVSHLNICRDLMKILEEMELNPKRTTRKGSHIVYFKDSENIEELLTYMGATNAVLEVMGAKIYKDMRNKVNRRFNFENANSDRTFNAAMEQTEAIKKIEKTIGLENLGSELKELAVLRSENPEMSLRELGENLSTPMSRSGVNHRLQKIMDIAKDIK